MYNVSNCRFYRFVTELKKKETHYEVFIDNYKSNISDRPVVLAFPHCLKSKDSVSVSTEKMTNTRIVSWCVMPLVTSAFQQVYNLQCASVLALCANIGYSTVLALAWHKRAPAQKPLPQTRLQLSFTHLFLLHMDQHCLVSLDWLHVSLLIKVYLNSEALRHILSI